MEKENQNYTKEVMRLKLEEMQFQYRSIENNYARLVGKCSFSMLATCVILGSVVNYQGNNNSTGFEWISLLILLAVVCLIVSFIYLVRTLMFSRQSFVKHQQIAMAELSSDILLGKLISSYHLMLTKLKKEITKSQKRYETSLKFLTLSIISACLHFLVLYGGYDLVVFLWRKTYV